MENQKLEAIIDKMFAEIENLIPVYMQNPEDRNIANGNVAVCIIADNGMVYGRMLGTNKPRLRQSYKVAWTKASQVWLTGVKTGEYEKMVFNGLAEENGNGIEAPDLIGWQGGQPWGEGTANFEVLLKWNASKVYTKTVAYFAEQLAATQ